MSGNTTPFRGAKTGLLSAGVLLAALTASLPAANWPAWRGPDQDGVTTESNLPLTWSTTENILWKTPLPDRGNATPVVWGDKVFVTQAIAKEGRRLLLCFDKKTGKKLWEAGTTYARDELTHATNPLCSGSPATDGRHVYVSFASAGLFCFDMDGKEVWKRTDLGEQRHIWGSGPSPVLAGNRVFFNFGPGAGTKLLCFDASTGKTLWQHDEPGGNSGEETGKKWLGSWGDPLLRKVGAREELFMGYPDRVCAFDPATGKELWTCGGLTPLFYNSPLYQDGVVVAMCGYNGAAVAVKAGGSGDVSNTHVVWRQPKVSQRIGTGVLYEGHHYILTDGGIAECRDLKTGNLVWSERLKGPGPTGQNWSSLVRSGDRLYAVNQGGDAFVFKAAPTFQLLATNSLGEKVIASIAVSDGLLFIRSHQHLWCIGKQ